MPSVVIVDDEPDIVKILCEYFDIENIDVLGTGNNGKDAVELCAKHSPDYLLLDLNMEKYDGFYTIENLPNFDNPQKIIVITGQIGEEIQKLENYDNITVLPKPFDIQQIVNIVKGKNSD